MNKKSEYYQKWRNIRLTLTVKEIFGVIIIAVLLITGAIFDMGQIHFICVQDFSTIALAVIQIQASISAISIALIALVSGGISEECYGISLSRYYVHIKPIVFKQIWIIIGSIVLIAINVVAYLLGFYNLVIAIMWASCSLICISVFEIYPAFKGKNNTVSEIETYLEYMLFDSNISFEKKEVLFSSYVNYWSSLSQCSVDYEQEKKRYSNAINALLEKDAERTLILLHVVSAELVKKLISVGDFSKRYRAIDVFYETYNQIWKYIKNHQLCHIHTGFQLYEECQRELILGMRTLPVQSIESAVHWERLTDIITRINIYCHTQEETDNESLIKNVRQIQWVPASIGDILLEKRLGGERIDLNRWQYDRSSLIFYTTGIPEDAEREYKKVKRQYNMAFYYSLLKNSQLDIASSLFSNDSKIYTNKTYDDIIFPLLIICYTYYIAEREKIDCISLDEKKAARELMAVIREKAVFANIVDAICWHSDSVDYSGFYDEIREVLCDFERIPSDGAFKLCIVDNVVKDFVLLLIVLACVYNTKHNLIVTTVSDENASMWYSSYLGNKYEQTEKLLSQMVQVMSKEDYVSKMLATGLGEFSSFVLNKYKKQKMRIAQDEYRGFLSKNKKGACIKSLEKSLEKQLRERCKDWLIDPEFKFTEERFHLLHFSIPLDFLDDSIHEQIIPYLESELLDCIGFRLLKLKKLYLFERDKSNEEEYLTIFADNDYIIVGSDWAFRPYTYNQRKDFDQLIVKHKRINIGDKSRGLLLTAGPLTIGIENISVSMHHKTIKECDYKIDSVTGLYEYASSSGDLLQYTREELEEYLYYESVVLDISVKLNIMNPSIMCGILIERN